MRKFQILLKWRRPLFVEYLQISWRAIVDFVAMSHLI